MNTLKLIGCLAALGLLAACTVNQAGVTEPTAAAQASAPASADDRDAPASAAAHEPPRLPPPFFLQPDNLIHALGLETVDDSAFAQTDTDLPAPPLRKIGKPSGDDLWARLRKGFQFDLEQDNHRIAIQLRWYQRNQAYLDRTANRARRYLHYIVSEAERRGIPMELALLPVVESAFDPFAYSHGRASGLWQFIPGTGRVFGLTQDWWYDGRRDVVASTHAAYDYLQSLAARFDGDYLLALASYNAGALNVERAIKNNRKRGLKTDYWHLKLPRETMAYVPKLIAIAKLVQDPERYGITLLSLPDEPYFDVVDIDSQIDLAQAAELANIDIEELYFLNPAFNRWATRPLGPHRLLVPIEQANAFRQGLAELPDERRLSWIRYSVQQGDTLSTIARKHQTTPSVIQQVNGLRNHLIRVNQPLLIPRAAADKATYSLSADNRLKAKQDTFRGGDGSTRVEYTVRAGDTLWEIASKHQVNVRKLARWNGMAPTDVLQPGRKLVIWSKAPTTVATVNLPPQLSQNREIIRKVNYRVRRGDSLARIANKFNVSVPDIVAWNELNPKKYLQPGQRLKLLVDVTQTYY